VCLVQSIDLKLDPYLRHDMHCIALYTFHTAQSDGAIYDRRVFDRTIVRYVGWALLTISPQDHEIIIKVE